MSLYDRFTCHAPPTGVFTKNLMAIVFLALPDSAYARSPMQDLKVYRINLDARALRKWTTIQAICHH